MDEPSSSKPSGLFTSCPVCEQQFRVRAKHLSIANGEVKCGYCGFFFNALSRLNDAPQTMTKAPPLEVVEPNVSTPSVADPTSQMSPAAFHIPNLAKDDMVADTTTGWLRQSGGTTAEQHSDTTPEILQAPSPVKRSLLGSIFLVCTALLLAIILIAQLAWWNRDELLRRYSVVTPYFEQLCERANCEILRYKDPSVIGLVNRDIRIHPLYADGLLVNATIVNRAGKIQPFPLVQLALFDINHTVIAHRKFTPETYLDDSINRGGMAPGVPVHFVLEIVAPEEEAIGFEFYFL